MMKISPKSNQVGGAKKGSSSGSQVGAPVGQSAMRKGGGASAFQGGKSGKGKC